MQTKIESYRVITMAAVGLLDLRSLVLKYKLKKASKSYVYRTEMGTLMCLWQGDSTVLDTAEEYAGWNMSKEIYKIWLLLYNRKKGTEIRPWQRDKRRMQMMMTELCVPLAHQLSPCIMKQKQIKVKRSPQDLLANTMTSERRRESHKVELRAWLWLSQRKGYMEFKHAQYGHIWLRKHCLIAGITT